ncbi:unnamed protein product, partial [Scytosiphon promiscuus]
MAATVDQGRNIINAWESMNVPVLICSGHRLNSAVTWGLGISGSFSQAGGGTCKNTVLRKLMAKIAAMVGHFSHSAVNNDAFKAVQREVQELAAVLELIRRNDTRWGSQHAMMSRVLRLYRCLSAYFTQNLTVRAMYPLEWQAALEVTSILDPAAMVTTQIQGGRHAFVGKAI